MGGERKEPRITQSLKPGSLEEWRLTHRNQEQWRETWFPGEWERLSCPTWRVWGPVNSWEPPIIFFQPQALYPRPVIRSDYLGDSALFTWGCIIFGVLLAIFPKAFSANDVITVWLGALQGHKHSNKIKAAWLSQHTQSTSTSLGSMLLR